MTLQFKHLGHPMLDQFLLDPDWKNFNHGAYGTYPKTVQAELRNFQDLTEARPDKFIRHQYPDYLNASRAELSRYLNVPVNELVLVKSATVAINTVLRNLTFTPQDTILYFSTIFDACEKTIHSVMEITPLTARKIEVTFPISHDEIVARFRATIQQVRAEGGNVRIALFDTISSAPGVRFPFERLVRICREENILSCVDGAHGIGQIPLDLGELDADFFVSMTHKWLYNPRGCSIFHVPTRNQHLIRTTIPTSHCFIPKGHSAAAASATEKHAPNKSPFELLFQNVATTDDTPYLTAPAALKFRAQIPGGEEAIFTYIREIAFEGGNLVAQILGTEVLGEGLADGRLCRVRECGFANVRLPFLVLDSGKVAGDGLKGESQWPVLSPSQAVAVARWMQERLVAEYSTSVTALVHNSALWARISGQIYLEMGDFQWLGQALKELCDRVGSDLDGVVG